MHSLIEVFPASRAGNGLLPEDFVRFRSSFSEIICSRFPGEVAVAFFRDADALARSLSDVSHPNVFKESCRKLETGESQYLQEAGCFVIAIPCNNESKMFVSVRNLDDIFLKRMADDWISESIRAIHRDFLLFKQARVDSRTGLLNLFNFEYLLQSLQQDYHYKIVLVEIPPMRVSTVKLHQHLQKAVSVLSAYFQQNSALHYLGSCIFASVVREQAETKGEFEAALVSSLKRAGFRRVHIGTVGSREIRDYFQREAEWLSADLLDMCWTALRYATRRGPYSYCDYHSLIAPQEHDLAAPTIEAFNSLQKLAAKKQTFSLAITNAMDQEDVAEWADINQLIPVFDTAFLYLFSPGDDAEELAGKIRDYSKKDGALRVKACGVAAFPFLSYSRKSTINNCKKAYRHAQLLGEGQVVVFDSLSLNVSGDIYFAEGDLVNAAREYGQGLQLVADDVNLNNSLGVTLALMDKVAQAGICFQKVLEVEPDNFMALYNLGLAELGKGREEKALELLLKAAAQIDTAEGSDFLADDLYIQIGRLAVEQGEYSLALQYLNGRSGNRAEFAHYPAGLAYYSVGEKKLAMIELQRALQVDEFDAKAMGLLGKLYYEENQGIDVALALCRKSMQLDPANDDNCIFYGELCAFAGRFDEAKNVVRNYLRRKKSRTRAQLAMARICRSEKKYKNAMAWLNKILAVSTGRSSTHFRKLARSEKNELLREMGNN